MNSVLTEKQAREITGGRKPHVPIEYEEAIKSLDACITLDEAKHWSDKADALAAWAKIYHSDEAERKSKMLKLHAFRRMGELARELRPQTHIKDKVTGKAIGTTPGAVALLKETGLKKSDANAASLISRMPKDRFDEVIASAKPPTVGRLHLELRKSGKSEAWRELTGSGGLSSSRSWCRSHPAKALARSLKEDESKEARKMVVELSEWLDEFETWLPKANK